MFLAAVIVRTRSEYVERQRRTDTTAAAFHSRVETPLHGLRLH